MNMQELPREAIEQIPSYVTRRLKDIDEMVTNLEYGNFEKVKEIAFRIRGNSQAYGFDEVYHDAVKIEEGCDRGKEAIVLSGLMDMRDHVEKINIEWRTKIVH